MQIAPTGEGYRSPEQLIAYWDQVVERVSAAPGVERVALTGTPPMGGQFSLLSYGVAGKPELPPSQAPLAYLTAVSPAFFETLGIPVVQGRELNRSDAVPDPRVVVINEAMARREFADRNPLGQRFTFGPGPDGEEQWLEVVGVAANIRQYGIEQEPPPTIFVPHTFFPSQPLTILVRAAGDSSSVAGGIRGALQAIDPALPITRMRPLDELIGASLTQRRFNMTLLAVFAGIELVLAIAGIYGTVAYAAAQRTQHAQRGADPGDIPPLLR